MAQTDTLKIFVEAVQTKNFSIAAKRLGITPSAVSKQIGQLEERLAVRLLNRTTRSINTTEAGLVYYHRCLQILEDIEETEQLVRDLESSPKGKVKFIVPTIFGRSVIARVVADIYKKYPELRIEINIDDTPIESATNFDLGVKVGELPDSNLVAKLFGPMSLVMCASPSYIEIHGQPTDMSDLINHELIVLKGHEYADPCRNREIRGQVNLSKMEMRFEAYDLDMAYHATHAGIGIAILPRFLVIRHLMEGRLIRVLPTFETTGEPVHLVYPKNKFLSKKTKAVIDFTTDYFVNWDEQRKGL